MIKLIDLLKETQISSVDVNHIIKRVEKEQDLTIPYWEEFTPEICNNGFCDIFAEKFRQEYPGSELWGTEWSVGDTYGHVWVKFNNKFYDAETKDGVTDWKNLPYIQNIYKKLNKYPNDVKNIA